MLYLAFGSLAARVGRLAALPRWILAVITAVSAALYIVLLLSHDLFVVDIYSAMAESPHFLPSALALLLLLGGWIARSPRRRIIVLALASVAAYASVMIKPHTLVAMALCVASLIVVGLRHHRAFRSPAVVAVCVRRIDAGHESARRSGHAAQHGLRTQDPVLRC